MSFCATHQVSAQEKKDSIRAINKYGFLKYDAPGARAIKSIPSVKEDTEDESWENIGKNVQTSFSLPFEDFLKKPSVTDGVSGSVNFVFPLSRTGLDSRNGNLTQGIILASAALSASVSYMPLSYWFVNVTAFRYLQPELQQSWNPDFTYSFGYDDWHPYTFSLTYSNFGGNRFRPDASKGERFTHFEHGVWALGWKFPAAKVIENLVVVHPSGGLGHSVHIHAVPRYRDAATNEERAWKIIAGLNSKYTIYDHFYITFGLSYYPIPGQQQPWDPDFTYGFGYFDWHPGAISVQYNNFAGNRFPWNRHPTVPPGTIFDGSISISWNFAF